MHLMRSAYWHTSPIAYEKIRKLSRSLGVHEVTAAVLARRGYDSQESAGAFLQPHGIIHDPFLFPQMDSACRRLQQAIENGEHICVHGDYDVDGITATAVLLNVLRGLGANADYHLPHRFSEGYGISGETIASLADRGVSLLVTVDCGIGARREIELASAAGMDVIVTDHHRPVEDSLPETIVISPLLCDYPFKDLAGAGLAFKLAQGLIATLKKGDGGGLHPLLQRQLDLVALGTIADVVPLLDENRSLVQRGLVQLSRTSNPGLLALMRAGQVEPSRVNSGLVAFRLAPRINAAGRLDDPALALDMLLAETGQQAEELAGNLEALNRDRQKLENRILAEAQELISRWTEEEKARRGYVLSASGWHEGVIGIVASRLVELHYRPVIMITEGDTTGKGSGRSIPAFDLHASLSDLAYLMQSFGGHRAACGLTIEIDKIDKFRDEFAEAARTKLGGDELQRSRFVDAMVLGREMTLELAEELSQLEPFGLGNPAVELVASGARIQGGRKTRNGDHLQCRIESGGVSAGAIGFGQAHLLEKLNPAATWDVVFRLEQNEFNGTISPQLNLREIFPREPASAPPKGLCKNHCNQECPDRIRGQEFWELLTSGAIFPPPWATGTGESGSSAISEDRIIDRRNYGAIPQQLARMASSGDSLLLLVADVPRRRRLLSLDLPLNNEAVCHMYLAGARCGRTVLNQRLNALKREEGNHSILMADFFTISMIPDLASGFDHLMFVDPPFNEDILKCIANSAPDALIHLLYCNDELQFTLRVLEHEYDLRSQMVKLYRHLKTGYSHILDDSTEALLLAGGKYLRQPATVARCLRVLEELSLISIEEKGKEPILTVPESGKTDLERSPTFIESKAFYERCLKYLNK